MSDKSNPQGQKQRRNTGYQGRQRRSYRRNYRRNPSPAVQLLTDTALDLLGTLAIVVALGQVIPIPQDRTVIAICLLVVGIDVIFRLSLRQLPGRVVRGVSSLIQSSNARRARLEQADMPLGNPEQVVLSPEIGQSPLPIPAE